MAAVGTPWLACRTQSEWRTALTGLLDDEEARRQAASLGRAFVTANFSEEQIISSWDGLFRSLGFAVPPFAGDRPRCRPELATAGDICSESRR